MLRRHMGRSGLTVGRLGLGTMMWGRSTPAEDAHEQLELFVASGGDLVDTAHGYGDGAAEEMLGALLGHVVGRDEIVLCTKAGITRRSGERVVDTSRRSLLAQLETSLTRLGTDHVDLWLVHAWSARTPVEETVSALEWAVSSGRARYAGVSNHGGWHSARTMSLLEQRGIPVVANEVEYSLLHRMPEDEVIPAARHLGLGVLPWAPLGRGVLTGKYRHGTPADSRAASGEHRAFVDRFADADARQVVEAVHTAAHGLGVSATEVALAWVRDRAGVVAPVVGTRTSTQLRAVLRVEDLELPPEIVRALDDVSD